MSSSETHELTEPGEAQRIRYIVEPLSSRHGLIPSTATVPIPGRQLLIATYAAPLVFVWLTRFLSAGGSLSPTWSFLNWCALAIEGGMLLFRTALRRRIERVAIRWTTRSGRAAATSSFEGTVVADVTVVSNLSDRAAVLVRTRRLDPALKMFYDGLWGVEFTIAADDGARYAVAPSEHLYFDEAPEEPDHDRQVTETLLRPGDRVRVWGAAVSEPSALGERADLRSPPMRLALVGSERAPLVIRFARPATAVAAAAGRPLLLPP